MRGFRTGLEQPTFEVLKVQGLDGAADIFDFDTARATGRGSIRIESQLGPLGCLPKRIAKDLGQRT